MFTLSCYSMQWIKLSNITSSKYLNPLSTIYGFHGKGIESLLVTKVISVWYFKLKLFDLTKLIV